ncbi:hypothetical protein HUJ05_010012 [Dendroctonus ponderosae]|nr:hypothetical protein HUJ05_010012 [Dendroctonus ponderosae]
MHLSNQLKNLIRYLKEKISTMKFISALAILLVVAVMAQGGEYTERFLTLYNTIIDSKSGYFSKEGIPYHSVETLMIVSIDYGHETDSEAQSCFAKDECVCESNYNLWLKAMYGAISGDFSHFNQAWDVLDGYYVPEVQYNNEKYNPEAGGESNGVTVGIDPLGAELTSSYGDSRLRVMHWLLDVDNVYGFGNVQGKCEEGPSEPGPSFVNNGPGSLWQGITYPTCDTFKYGGDVGFSWYASVPNWGYSAAPDADARSILAAFWASQWATEQGKLGDISETLSKASELGDYLRYTLFDKHFKQVGNCIGKTACPGGEGKSSAHYLISWYIGWGGSIDSSGAYSWRKASSEGHIGYQNPMAAYALVNDPNLRPKSASAVEDWQNSLERQLELYKWVQTSEGPLGGGNDPNWSQLESYLNGGPAPTITYHRFWEQADLALALGAYGMLFNE